MQIIEQLQQLIPLAGSATTAPWFLTTDSDDYGTTYLITPQANSAMNERGEYNDLSSVSRLGDAAFIAAARNLLTPENLTLIIGLLGNMESVMETNRVLAKRQVEIQNILRQDLFADEATDKIYTILNPTK